jgi:prepilin-type N-terminal cleavage/methylation domain-containing protein
MNAKILRSQKGFTLIELMIVVGIIGILVAIAAPNFSRYQSRARQSEAKIGLSAIYAGEKSFYSEYSAYAANLNIIGYVPEGSKRYYTIGFNSMDTASVNGVNGTQLTAASTVTDTAICGEGGCVNFRFGRYGFPATWTNCTVSNAGTGAGGADPQTFLAGASGQVRQNQAACDTWTIDDKKDTRNTIVGL